MTESRFKGESRSRVTSGSGPTDNGTASGFASEPASCVNPSLFLYATLVYALLLITCLPRFIFFFVMQAAGYPPSAPVTHLH